MSTEKRVRIINNKEILLVDDLSTEENLRKTMEELFKNELVFIRYDDPETWFKTRARLSNYLMDECAWMQDQEYTIVMKVFNYLSEQYVLVKMLVDPKKFEKEYLEYLEKENLHFYKDIGLYFKES